MTRLDGARWRATPSSSALLRDVIGNQLQQLVFLIRLAEIVVDADLEGVVAVLVGGARGDHDDRDVLQVRVGADIASQIRSRPCAAFRCRPA